VIADVLIAGGLTLVVGLLAAAVLRRLPSVRMQLAALAVVAVALPLGAVLLSGLVMFHMGSELGVVAVSVTTGVVVLIGALALAHNITRRLDGVRDASVRLAAGELGERAPTGGPTEIAELASSFNAMAEHLEEVFDARRQLVAWASHDLRAPVTSLQAMLEAIEDGVVEPADYLEALQGQVRLLTALVEDLFQLAAIDAGALVIDPVERDVAELVSACVTRFDVEARAKHLELRTVVRDPGATARCSAAEVERVLNNLLTNALRHTPAGGRVTVAVTKGAGSVFVSVEDTGVGIAPEAFERVFDPFYRIDQARTPTQGTTGLGLAIARGLLEAQGGRIWAEPPVAGGTRICFALPAGDDAPAGPDPSGAVQVTPASPSSAISSQE